MNPRGHGRYWNRKDYMYFKVRHNRRKSQQSQEDITMHGLETIEQKNTEAVIHAVIERANHEGVKVTREGILDALKFRESDDVSVWEATVDRIMTEYAR